MTREEMYNADNETTREEMYKSNVSLPPAEGAEQLTKEQFTAIIEDSVKDVWYGRRSMNPVKEQTELLVEKLYPLMNRQQPTAKGAEEWIKNLTELRINMQDLMLYYSKSGHDFTTPVIDILLEMREKCLDGSVIYSKIKSTVLWYPAKFIDWVNDNFYWDKGLDGYLPTTIKHQGMTFKTTDELLIYWAKDKHYSYHRKPMSNGLLPL